MYSILIPMLLPLTVFSAQFREYKGPRTMIVTGSQRSCRCSCWAGEVTICPRQCANDTDYQSVVTVTVIRIEQVITAKGALWGCTAIGEISVGSTMTSTWITGRTGCLCSHCANGLISRVSVHILQRGQTATYLGRRSERRNDRLWR
jgi:hypothetical protein